MIQDIAPHIYHNEYKPAAPDENSFLLYFEKDKALVKHVDGKICFPTFQDFPEFLNVQEPSGDCPWIYLFSIDDSRYYLAKTLNLSRLPEYQLETTRMFREAQPQHTAFAGITAHQLYGWYDTHRFCGRCGHSMLHSEKERMLHCPSCGFIEYPRISPAVIVGIVHNDKLLMSKYAGRTITHYALIAGFTEIGETVEETVRREVYEEVGLHVKNLHYYKVSPGPSPALCFLASSPSWTARMRLNWTPASWHAPDGSRGRKPLRSPQMQALQAR